MISACPLASAPAKSFRNPVTPAACFCSNFRMPELSFAEMFRVAGKGQPVVDGNENGRRICRCCGGWMNVCSPGNPNICLDCETLTLDDSPLMAVGQAEAEFAPQASDPAKTFLVTEFNIPCSNR